MQLQVARCSGSGSWGYLGCISALRSKDIIHCARQQQQQHEWQRARALGALESAGADNNSYMWHDEFLATRRSFLLVSLSSRTPGHFLWTQLGRKTDKQTEGETERDRKRERASAAINKRCHCRSSVVTCSFSCVSFSLSPARSVFVSFQLWPLSCVSFVFQLCMCVVPTEAFMTRQRALARPGLPSRHLAKTRRAS